MTSSLACPPRWSTARDRSRATLGGRVAEIALALGTPLMPWQRQVADVALEVDDDGNLIYREVVLTVPRQSGKTQLILAVAVHRALAFGGPQRISYCSQTRNDSRAKLLDEQWPMLERSPVGRAARVRKALGAEAIIWRNGSMHVITSTTEKAGHGATLDLGFIDEAFSQGDDRLEQAYKPAMITRANPQLWVVSTAGTPESHYLRGKVDAGRARLSTGDDGRVAYFEWSADEDADPADPATWWSCMPALGHTVTEEAVGADFDSMDLREFRRAYLNQWVERKTEVVISPDVWAACADPASAPTDPVAFAVDVTIDRAWAAIAVAGLRADGVPHVEVVEHKRGTSWVAARMAELVAKWKPCAVGLDPSGPAGSLLPALQAVGIEPALIGARDQAQGCGAFYDAVVTAQVRHRDQPDLNAAIAGAKKRPLGDAWAWHRKDATVDISPLVAATEALWAFTVHRHDDAPRDAGIWVL